MISERAFLIATTQWKVYCRSRPAVEKAFGKELPEELLGVLNEVDDLVSTAAMHTGGSLRSRQVIAGLIVTWGLSRISEREKEE